ncbi:MAG: double-strand break repair helicase HerA and related ATPase, partial [Pseudomonadota bacterium]|nr:double-strand break repair helicase HerA and related ATPase [Pseudomonadota bacterium]
VYGVYEKAEDRESAYEKLKAQPAAAEAAPAPAEAPAAGGGWLDGLGSIFGGGAKPAARGREGVVEAAAKSAARAIGSQVGREIIRGVLGSILGGGRRR